MKPFQEKDVVTQIVKKVVITLEWIYPNQIKETSLVFSQKSMTFLLLLDISISIKWVRKNLYLSMTGCLKQNKKGVSSLLQSAILNHLLNKKHTRQG